MALGGLEHGNRTTAGQRFVQRAHLMRSIASRGNALDRRAAVPSCSALWLRLVMRYLATPDALAYAVLCLRTEDEAL